MSYRQAGKRMRGAVRKGPPPASTGGDQPPAHARRARVKRTTASIPSKFETTLHTGVRELNAFGNRTYRFRVEENENPGPGSYRSGRATLVRSADTCGSVSRKGYGVGFVSKSMRFTDNSALVAAEPGPGQYETRPFLSTVGTLRGRGSFAPPRHFDGASSAKETPPGPGHYDPYTTARRATAHDFRAKASSSFASRSRRGFDPQVDGPAPGAYDPQMVTDLASRRAALPDGAVSQATFRSKTMRGERMQPGETPGPGSYDGMTKAPRRLRRVMPSSMFSNVGQDRFGNPYVRKTAMEMNPGPGTYAHDSIQKRDRALASSSYFMSNTRRGLTNLAGKPPGPAFYKPSLQQKKSFLLNASRRWT